MSGEPWGGSEELWCKIASEAILREINTSILIKDWGVRKVNQIEEIERKGAKMFYFNKNKTRKKAIEKFNWKITISETSNFIDKNVELVKTINPDVILLNFGGAYDIASYSWLNLLIRDKKIPYFVIQQFNTENSHLSYQDVSLVRRFFESAVCSYFVSHRGLQTTKRNLISELLNSKVVSNPLKLKIDSPLDYPETDCIHFACVARLQCNIKCQDMLIEVFSKPEWENKNWHLNFYGKGDDFDFMNELVKFYGLQKKITLHGHTKDISDIWRNNNILILPSIAEGTPLSLIEAMFCGRTAIVLDVGGNNELIEDESNGFIIHGISVPAINATLNRAWLRKDEWKDMGIKACITVKNKINLKSSTEILNDLIEIR
jgi:glycosyltransferase involved in cell wall biosynthesis